MTNQTSSTNNTVVDRVTYKILYLRYKKYLVPLCIIVVCILLLFFLLIPQINDYFQTKEQEAVLQQEVALLNENIRLLSSMPDVQLENDLSVVSAALPPYKDYSGIIRAINGASQVSGVSVDDYSFAIGVLAPSTVESSAVQTIEIDLTLHGSLSGAKEFAGALAQSLPLADVVSLENTGVSSKVKVMFVYKPPSNITVNYNSPLPTLSSKDVQTIKKLQGWQQASGNFAPLILVGSESAIASSSGSGSSPF